MSSPTHAPPPDRRALGRRACHRPCLVRFDRRHLDGRPGSVAAEAEIQDLSPAGVGLLLKPHLRPGVDLMLQPLDRDRPGLPPARVIRCVPCGGRWRHGCALQRHLSEEELRGWLM